MALVSMCSNHKERSFLYRKFRIWYHYFKLEEKNAVGNGGGDDGVLVAVVAMEKKEPFIWKKMFSLINN